MVCKMSTYTLFENSSKYDQKKKKNPVELVNLIKVKLLIIFFLYFKGISHFLLFLLSIVQYVAMYNGSVLKLPV